MVSSAFLSLSRFLESHCCAHYLIPNITFIFHYISSRRFTYVGCCCDSRRAVLVYSILVLIFSIIGVISFVVSELFTTNYFRAALIISIVSIVVSVIVICGAIFYNMWLVGIGAVWTVIWIILSIVFALQRPEYVEWNSNGVTRVLYTPPALAIICAIIWGGLVLYVSFCPLICSNKPFATLQKTRLLMLMLFTKQFVSLKSRLSLNWARESWLLRLTRGVRNNHAAAFEHRFGGWDRSPCCL